MTKLKFEDVSFAFDIAGSGAQTDQTVYLSRETGETHWHSEFTDDEEPLPVDFEDTEKYLQIPHKNELGLGQNLLFRFVDVPDALETIERFFHRRGAYARAKNLLAERGVLKQWFAYEDEALKRAVRDWCAENGIELEG
jgi:hypothetical protein